MKLPGVDIIGVPHLLVVSLVVLAIVFWFINRPIFSARNLSLLLLRIVCVLSLFISLYEPYYESVRDVLSLNVLVDISDSMNEPVGSELLKTIESFEKEEVEITVRPFAGELAPFETDFGSLDSYEKLKRSWQKLNIGETNIEAALSSSRTSPIKNLLLISDGNETAGSLERVISSLKDGELRVYPLIPKSSAKTSESFEVSSLHAPLVAPAKKSVEIQAAIRNTFSQERSGKLRITHGEKELFNKAVELKPGEEFVLKLDSDPSQEGITEVRAELTPNESRLPPSAQTVFISGEKREKVLLISGSRADARGIADALRDQSYQLTDLVLPSGAAKFSPLKEYSVVIFNNVPKNALPAGLIPKLETYVKNGGGFIMLGSNRSFGLGNYKGTAVEDVLPVSLVPPKTKKKRLNVGVILVLDKSRSMASGSKIDFAKEAAREVIKNLKDDDYIGIIGFDNAPFVVVKVGQIRKIRSHALERISRLFAAGRTNLYPALDEGRRSMLRVNAGRKHVIVMTDGKLPDAGPQYTNLVKNMRLAGITVSTVMLGSEADVWLLKQMAEVGGGSFYRTTDPRALPRIFLSDVRVSTGEDTVKEADEYVVKKGPGRLSSTEVKSFPPLKGYVETKAKAKANLELVSYADGKNAPLLVSWAYGKGRSIAYTSDANGRWSQYWLKWRKFNQFWSDLVDSLRDKSNAHDEQIKFDLRHHVKGKSLFLDVSVYSDAVRRGLAGTIRFPSGETKSVTFDSLAAGRFQVVVPDIIAGTYELEMNAGDKKLTPVAFNLSGEHFGEKKGQGFNAPLLSRLAEKTGAKVNPSFEDLKRNAVQSKEKQDLSWLFLTIAGLSLLLTIIIRERI